MMKGICPICRAGTNFKWRQAVRRFRIPTSPPFFACSNRHASMVVGGPVVMVDYNPHEGDLMIRDSTQLLAIQSIYDPFRED